MVVYLQSVLLTASAGNVTLDPLSIQFTATTVLSLQIKDPLYEFKRNHLRDRESTFGLHRSTVCAFPGPIFNIIVPYLLLWQYKYNIYEEVIGLVKPLVSSEKQQASQNPS